MAEDIAGRCRYYHSRHFGLAFNSDLSGSGSLSVRLISSPLPVMPGSELCLKKRATRDSRKGIPQSLTPLYLSATIRSRRALAITLTEDSDIAAAAMIGDNSIPVKG